jgi:oxygen-independent coproporphyrinogen-3 oxidase
MKVFVLKLLLKLLMPISLYIHVPFCLKRCIYCDFVSGIYDPEKAGAYVEALKKEISGIPAGTRFSTFYIGGGTPTVLSADLLSDLIRHVFTHLNFIENYEATIEANPGTIDKDKLRAIRSHGINRISIGIQSFHDDELIFLGRVHSSQEAAQAVCLARDAGFENIGMDFIYGIPGQNSISWMKTLEMAVSLKPEHISTYELTVEKGTKLHKYLNNPPLFLPLDKGRIGGVKEMLPEEKIIEMYEHTIDFLTSQNYIHYEISNFALPDNFCRHNLNYWDRGEYYGVGLGAHSFVKGNRFYNTANLDDYLNALSEDKSPVKGTEHISEDMAVSEALFLGLRKTTGVNLRTVSESYKQDLMRMYQKEIKELEESGLVEYNSRSFNLKLTRKGLLLSNEVFTRFM